MADARSRRVADEPGRAVAKSLSGNPAASAPVMAVDNWSMFRGCPRLTGVTSEPLPENLVVQWKFQTDEREPVTSTAAIVEGTVYVGCENGILYALKLDDGKPIWSYKTKESAAIKSSPTVIDNLVLFGDEGGEMHAIEAATGKKMWVFKAEGEIVSSPNLDGDRIVFGSYDGCIYCLSIADGKLLWKFTTEAQVHGTVGIADGVAVVGGCDGKVRVLQLSDGKEIRSAAVGAQTAASTALFGDRVFLGTLGNQVLCINWRTGEPVWTYENPDRAFPFHASAAATSDMVVIGGRDKSVHGIDPATGKLKWTHRAMGRVDSSPVIVLEVLTVGDSTKPPKANHRDSARDRVFVGSGDGHLYGLELRTGKVVWDYESGSAFSASPAVGGGRLVIGDEDGTVYCFGAKKK
ncbi:MAG: PQQ-binding-like beta-propeller repeat protein [Planctomycetes bacterium]|nr:PQQ-binding-like beta-propeller repeat protein [Planctomycetota bacterium]